MISSDLFIPKRSAPGLCKGAETGKRVGGFWRYMLWSAWVQDAVATLTASSNPLQGRDSITLSQVPSPAEGRLPPVLNIIGAWLRSSK